MKVNFKITKGNNKQTKPNINEKHWIQQKNISNNINSLHFENCLNKSSTIFNEFY